MKRFNYRIGNIEARKTKWYVINPTILGKGDEETIEIIEWQPNDESAIMIAYFETIGSSIRCILFNRVIHHNPMELMDVIRVAYVFLENQQEGE